MPPDEGGGRVGQRGADRGAVPRAAGDAERVVAARDLDVLGPRAQPREHPGEQVGREAASSAARSLSSMYTLPPLSSRVYTGRWRSSTWTSRCAFAQRFWRVVQAEERRRLEQVIRLRLSGG